MRLTRPRRESMTRDLLSAARLLKDIARLKRTIFLIEFALIVALFAYEVNSQYRLSRAHERDLVSSHLETTRDKAHLLVGMVRDTVATSREMVTSDRAALENLPLSEIVELEGYAFVSVSLGASLLARAGDGTETAFEVSDIFPPGVVQQWHDGLSAPHGLGEDQIHTTWFWFDGTPYFATAGPVISHVLDPGGGTGANMLDGVPVLLLVSRFDAARLASMAAHFDLPPMTSITRDDDDFNNGVVLETESGRRLGAIVWNTRLGGAIHLKELSFLVAGIAIVLFLIGRFLVSRMTAVGVVLDRFYEVNRREKSHLRSLIEASNDGLMVLDGEGRILDCNSTVLVRSGLPRSQIIGCKLDASMPDVSLDDPEFLAGEKTVRCRMRRLNGEIYWLDVGGSRFEDQGSEERYIIVSRDVSQRVAAEEAVWHQAHFDSLTELPNRALFTTRLNAEIMRAMEEGTQCVLLFIDLDGFKSVNDTYGHEAGDNLLVEVARRFGALIPQGAMAARLGGDEFGIILAAGTSPEEAEALAIETGRELARPFETLGAEIRIRASIGLARAPENGGTSSELMRAADKAMYTAKRMAEGGYAVARRGVEMDGLNDGYRAVKRYS